MLKKAMVKLKLSGDKGNVYTTLLMKDFSSVKEKIEEAFEFPLQTTTDITEFEDHIKNNCEDDEMIQYLQNVVEYINEAKQLNKVVIHLFGLLPSVKRRPFS